MAASCCSAAVLNSGDLIKYFLYLKISIFPSYRKARQADVLPWMRIKHDGGNASRKVFNTWLCLYVLQLGFLIIMGGGIEILC